MLAILDECRPQVLFHRLLRRLQSKKPQSERDWGFLGCKSLTMTYFHTGTRTIIGAKSFHCPVRDGKEWDQLAMVIRHNLVLGSFCELPGEFIESGIRFLCFDCV